MLTLSNWVEVGRKLNGTPTIASDPEWLDEYQAVGRYINVELDGVKHKVFYFEAGQGDTGTVSAHGGQRKPPMAASARRPRTKPKNTGLSLMTSRHTVNRIRPRAVNFSMPIYS